MNSQALVSKSSPKRFAGDLSGAKLRATAALLITRVIKQGRSLRDTLPHYETDIPIRDHALLRELSYGVVRWYYPLHFLASCLLSKTLKARDHDIEALLLLGLYQLFYLRTPAYAAVSASTEAARVLGKPWACGLINGVLRQAERQQPALFKALQNSSSTASAHPQWLLQALQNAWPQDWEAIIEANNQHPPQSLRVNCRRLSRKDYLKQLHERGIKAEVAAHTDVGIDLAEPTDVAKLPGFAEGICSVQDPAAQLAAPLLKAQTGERILDACSAPGGKTGHILELTDGIELWAVDKSADRMALVSDNLNRLRLSAHLITADAADIEQWWDGKLFDRILLDAPCSGSGVIRRHPDIKVLRQAEDIPALATQQLHLLTALWPALKNGGLMLYASCSVLPDETHQLIDIFCRSQAGACADPIKASWGRIAGPGRQILPGSMDGFFYARLRKLG